MPNADSESKAYAQMQVALELGAMLRRAKMSQRALAHIVGVSPSRISQLLSGGMNPTLATLTRIAYALGCQIEIRFTQR